MSKRVHVRKRQPVVEVRQRAKYLNVRDAPVRIAVMGSDELPDMPATGNQRNDKLNK